MESLLRTRVSECSLENALKLSEVEALIKEEDFSFVHSVDSVFLQYEKAVVDERFNKILYNGNRIEPEMLKEAVTGEQDKPVRIYDEKGQFIGVYEFQEDRGNYKPVKIFMES